MSEKDGIIRWKHCKKHDKDYLVYCPDCEKEKERGTKLNRKRKGKTHSKVPQSSQGVVSLEDLEK